MKIPLGKPFLGKEEQDAIRKVIESRAIASGQVTRAFEVALAKKFNRRYCILVNSGTTALYLSLKVLKIKKVILPSLTCIQVLNATLNAGSVPIFADVDPETHNIDLSTLSERQLTEADSIIVTHSYGHSADINILRQFIEKYQVSFIEDFSQAIGGYFENTIIGSFGKVSVTSFYATKNMTTGHGGAVLTDDLEIYQRLQYASGERDSEYYADIVPLNLRMTDIQAAMGLVQLNKLDAMVDMRREAAQKLSSLLKTLEVETPLERPGVKHTYYKYHVVLPEKINKRDFIEEMDKEGISVGVLYDLPLHKTLRAKSVLSTPVELPISEGISPRIVSLPIFPEMTVKDISKIFLSMSHVLKTYKKISQYEKEKETL